MLRVLRLMAAVGCIAMGILCAVLWRRSVTRCDGTWAGHPYSSIYSAEGRIVVRFTGNPFTDPPRFRELIDRYRVDPIVKEESIHPREEEEAWWEQESVLGFAWHETPPGATWINFPHWAPIVQSAILGIAFAYKLPVRFGLRGLLIVTTLLALLLGAGMFLYRR